MIPYSVLHEAIKSHDIDVVKAYRKSIKDKSQVRIITDAKDEHGYNALILACVAGNIDMVKTLIDEWGCKAQPDAPYRHTPLRAAALLGHHHIIELLLSCGGDPNAVSVGNRTPLMGACFLRDVSTTTTTSSSKMADISRECVKILLNDPRTDPHLVNDFGETALDLAKRRGYAESIQLLEAHAQ